MRHISMRSEINSSKQRNVRHDKLFCILCVLPQDFPGKVFGRAAGGGGGQAVNIFLQTHPYSSFWNVV